MKRFKFSITLVTAFILIFINTWVTIALGSILAAIRLVVQLTLRKNIKPENIDLFATDGRIMELLSNLVLWDALQFDPTKLLIAAVKSGNYFDVLIALYAGADAELGMMANMSSSVPNQEVIKNALFHFGAEKIEEFDEIASIDEASNEETLSMDELDLDLYYPIRDLSMDFFEAEGIIDKDNRPIKLDQIKGVMVAVERFGVRKIENTETLLTHNRVAVKNEDEIDHAIHSFLSRFSMHENVRDQQLTFYSNSQKVPCINPLCHNGKVICPVCDGEKTLICERCDGTGKNEIDAVISEPVQEVSPCPECNGTGFEPGLVTQIECECTDESALTTPMMDCKVCGGKGIINQDFCHNCEGTGKVCALCGGSGLIEITEEGPVCKNCGGAGVIVVQSQIRKIEAKACKQCGGIGRALCKTCNGIGILDCESCEGHGHMYRNVRLDIVLDAFPSGGNSSYVQFDQDEVNRLFVSDHVKIISTLRNIKDVKIYRHEDHMVGKLFHNPTNLVLVGVNSFLGAIDAPYNQAYERVELIVSTYHYVTMNLSDGTMKRILFLNEKICLTH